MLLTLIAADAFDDNTLGDVKSSFTKVIGDVVKQVVADRDIRQWNSVDVEVAAPITMAMIMASALLEGWIFPMAKSKPERLRVLAEMARYVLQALKPPGEVPATLVT
jgi:hypothetical protein